jgi:hypothetical protein
MIRRTLNLTLILLVIGTFAAGASDQSQLKQCNVQSKQLTLQKMQRPLRLYGPILSQTTREYLITVKSDMTVDIQMTTDSSLKFDVYLLDPPTIMEKKTDKWSGMFEGGKRYTLAVSNCSGKSAATYQINLTPR